MTNNDQFVIIVAGGSGSRMGRKIPKQFIEIGGKPILMHTVELFFEYLATIQVILVLPPNQMKEWYALCDKHDFYPAMVTTTGGNTRFQSVQNGLKKIKAKDGLVAVHDGVRPFVNIETIAQSYQTAAEVGAAVTCVSLKDSIRIVSNSGSSQAVNRADYRLIQTPQTFRLDWFRQAYSTEEQPFFTDCASVLEHANYPITLIEGSYQNIKITTPDDLIWAEVLLESEVK
jgi:2-C-methyl-D-erythritol 4-phosphate cytidylyltransferase